MLALAGNPNSGKTTLFNALTGTRYHVGNWPGTTVEVKTGTHLSEGGELLVVDLPGTYSLAPSSPEQTLTREYLLGRTADVVAVVIDAANLERNLYLAVQVLEIGVPAILVMNMWDVIEAEGVSIDVDTLAARLGFPVVPVVARRRRGLDCLVDTVARVLPVPAP